MQTSSLEIENLKTSIEEKIHHAYLEKYLQKPVINEDKLLMLTSIVTNSSLSDSKKKQYIITTMLVQIALDTHDLVAKTTEMDEGKVEKKTRQLTVLAGDYYSGLYYLLLSEIEDYAMIHVLASAIKEINEFKMRIYYREVDSFHEFIDLVKHVESLLILRVAEHIQESALKSITEEWLVTSKLLQEKKRYFKEGYSPIFDSWQEQSSQYTYKSLSIKVDSIIQDKLLQMEELVSQLPIQLTVLKAHITDIINVYSYKKI